MLAWLRQFTVQDEIGQQGLQAKLMHHSDGLFIVEEAKTAKQLDVESLHSWL